MGIKKSVVLIMALPSPKSYTAASSRVSLPTNKFLSASYFMALCKIVSNTAGAILHPQPAPCEYCVNLISSIGIHLLN